MPRKSVAHHQVFNPVAQLVNEQDGEVVHCLSKLNPEGLKQKSLKSVSNLSPWGTKYLQKVGHPGNIPPCITVGCILATGSHKMAFQTEAGEGNTA